MKERYIKLWERIKESNLWPTGKFSKLDAWIDLLISARGVDGKWQGIDLKRGDLPTSQVKLAKEWSWSIGSVNKFLNRLKSESRIETKTTNHFTIISILNYDIYNPQNESQRKNGVKSTEKRSETLNERNERNEYRTIESVEDLIPYFKEKYPRINVAAEYEAIASWVHAKGKEKEYKDFKAMFNGCLLRKNKELPEKVRPKNHMLGEGGYVEI